MTEEEWKEHLVEELAALTLDDFKPKLGQKFLFPPIGRGEKVVGRCNKELIPLMVLALKKKEVHDQLRRSLAELKKGFLHGNDSAIEIAGPEHAAAKLKREIAESKEDCRMCIDLFWAGLPDHLKDEQYVQIREDGVYVLYSPPDREEILGKFIGKMEKIKRDRQSTNN